MRLPAKCDVRDAITPPPRSVRVPPVGGRPRGLTRVGCCESHRPSNRSVSVWASETFQSNRRNATALSVVRLSERPWTCAGARSEEHTSELQSQSNLVCRLLLEKKKIKAQPHVLHESARGEAGRGRSERMQVGEDYQQQGGEGTEGNQDQPRT